MLQMNVFICQLWSPLKQSLTSSLVSAALLQNESPNSFFRSISPLPQRLQEIYFSQGQRRDARVRIESIILPKAHSLNQCTVRVSISKRSIPPRLHPMLCLKPFQLGDDSDHRDLLSKDTVPNETHNIWHDRRLLFPKTIYK